MVDLNCILELELIDGLGGGKGKGTEMNPCMWGFSS